MKQCKIKIEVLADLLLSGGEGSALGLDRAVTRDVDGNLELRASHLMGVWREAAREWAVLADAVQFDDSTRWRALADQLFGTDRHRRLMGVGQVQLATTAAQAVAWQTTAREAWSRRPKDDTLRAVEAVPAGTTFDATLWSQADDNVHVEALVAGSLQRLTALGGSRNRGWGRVRIEVGHWATVESNSPPKLIAESGQSDLHRLRLALRVDTPVLLTDTSVPGDLLPTAVVVPGAALRGAVLTALRKVAGADVAEQAATHALFGDALPVPAQAIAQLDHLETLPVPLTLQAVKRVVNKAQAPSGGRAAPWWAEATTGAPHVTSDSHADRLATAASNDGD
ncbi:MAG: hypothetical protein FJ100_23225, partial [Deltaproteobacteria bacterium]|nr:hypothetical protein [Deltaproteobacteria bacterium]